MLSTENVWKVNRIGKFDNGKNRPIKVVMADEEAKRLIYKNLSNLKQFPKYQGVGLTDDYTPAERQLLKGWIFKAKPRPKPTIRSFGEFVDR